MSTTLKVDDLVSRDREHECEGFGHGRVCVRVVAVADLPSRFGTFRIVGFWNNRDQKDHIAIVHGDVVGAEDVPTRMHSECLTGDALGSLRCDCRDQLEAALERIGKAERGIVLYLRQEGRGIGLTNKIRAYALQDRGHDTVEANQMLGFGDDERDYQVAADMLRALGVRSVKLMTNNPRKLDGLRQHGIRVTGRLPLVTAANRSNAGYLLTKQKRSGHWLGMADEATTDTPAVPANVRMLTLPPEQLAAGAPAKA
jgi:GTP cyclohydrolase II